jgi:carboxypeptidase C (cathepsin A)
MTDKINENKNETPKYNPPKGSITYHNMEINNKRIEYTAHADWIILQKNEKPMSEMFCVAYFQGKDQFDSNRPLTFVFNGGPGAASAYLHLGTVGPKIAPFNDDGSAPKPPTKLIDNDSSWLDFTDLCFVDPIGTGFSRMIDEEEINKGKDKEDKQKVDQEEYFNLKRDLESLGEFITKFLSKHKRWESPIYLAGESYGGFRTAALAKRLQLDQGVGLNGIIIISPALEFSTLSPTDYDIQSWSDLFSTMAFTAMWHGKSRMFSKDSNPEMVLREAEHFAHTEMISMLSMGSDFDPKQKSITLKKISDYLGLDEKLVTKAEGRIPFWRFCRLLLKEEDRVLGYHDSGQVGLDPYPDKEWSEAPDPALGAAERVFTTGANSHIRQNLNIDINRDYNLLNMKANAAWKMSERHAFERSVGATDELRFGMALNPHMKVIIVHGYHDLVTPYYTSKRLVNQMRLKPEQLENITMKNYLGGHMFYTRTDSRKKFSKDIEMFINESK